MVLNRWWNGLLAHPNSVTLGNIPGTQVIVGQQLDKLRQLGHGSVAQTFGTKFFINAIGTLKQSFQDSMVIGFGTTCKKFGTRFVGHGYGYGKRPMGTNRMWGRPLRAPLTLN